MVLTGHPLAAEPGRLPIETAEIRRIALDTAGVSITRACQTGEYGTELAELGLRTRIVVDEIIRKVIKAMASMTPSLIAGKLVDDDAQAMKHWTVRAIANTGVSVPSEQLDAFSRLVGDSILAAYAPYVRAVSGNVRTVT